MLLPSHVPSPLVYLKDRYQDLSYKLYLLMTFLSLLLIFLLDICRRYIFNSLRKCSWQFIVWKQSFASCLRLVTSNKLTLNLTKIKYLIFLPRQKENYNLYPPLSVANVHLQKSFCVKYLGVYIDCHLTWHDHIDYICGKISKNINIMVKLKHYVSKATLISVYYSLIYPYLTYACTLWGNNYNAPLSQIVKLQNKAVRVINDVPLMESITPHYTSLGLLKFPDIVKLNTCMLFYDYFHHKKFPDIPVSLFLAI